MKQFSNNLPNGNKLILSKYIPENAVPLVEHLLVSYKVSLKIVGGRISKHGDFRSYSDGRTQITINNTLNEYQFLLTLIHEIAHLVTHLKFGRVQPHGKQWKMTFQHLMLPFLKLKIYPNEILPYLVNYLRNPLASTDSDVLLSRALKGFKASEGMVFVFEVKFGGFFLFKNTLYRRGHIRRTRYECVNLSNKKTYIFNQNTEVILYESS